MSVAARSAPRAARGRRIELPPARTLAVAAGACALAAVSVSLRTTALGAGLWIDEGLSVGIGSHDLLDIPGVLRQDGSPPLYYALLHVWMEAIGSRSEVTVHLLSVVFAVLTVPAALWAGRSLFGPRAGWIAAALATVNPFLTYFAQEARMYALAVLLGLVFAATFAHVFAFGRRGYLPAFAIALALLLYTHAWALFLAAAAICALVPCWHAAADRRALLRDAAIGFGAAGLAFLPWLPSFVHQIRHTGAPWAQRPDLDALAGVPELLLGGSAPALVLLLAGGAGLVAAVEGRRTQARTALIAVAVLTIAAALIAWLASQVSPAWAGRYFTLFLGPLTLFAAGALARAGRLGLVAAALLVVIWFGPRTSAVENKSNEQDVMAEVGPMLSKGDLVIVTHPERVPVVSYYLPDGLRYATPLGFVSDPGVMDWRDVLDRLERADPAATARTVLAGMRPGQRVLLVRPIIRRASWGSPWTGLVRRRSAEWGRVLERDPRLDRIDRSPSLTSAAVPHGVRTLLYRVTPVTPVAGP